MSAQPEAAGKARILICEEEILFAQDLARTLKSLGFTVGGTASAPDEAIRLAEELKPDLILMNMEMEGEIDGIGAAERIRARMDVPVVYLNGSTAGKVIERSEKTDPYGYLRLPVDSSELESTLEAVLHRHEADKRIRASEALRAKAEEFAGLHSWEWDMQTGHFSCSAEYSRVLGLPPESIEPTFDSFLNAVHPGDRDRVKRALRDAFNGVRPYDLEFRIMRQSGEERLLIGRAEVQRDPNGRPIRIQGMGLDVTERKKAEEHLKLERDQLLAILSSINEVISVIDAQTYEILYVNPFMKNLHGKSLVGSSCYKAIHGSDTPCDHCAKDRAFAVKGDPHRWNYHNPTLHRDYLATDRIITWTDGRDAKLHLGVDVTELRKAERAFLAREAQLTNAVEMAHLGHWEYDLVQDLFTFNDQFYKLFRTTVEQVGSYTLSSAEYAQRFVHPEDISVVGDEIRKAVETDDPYFSRDLEHRIVYADGEVGYITVRFFIVKDEQGRTVKTYGVNQDITGRKRWEEVRLQSQRLRAVADLAGGVAHNFNNLLQIVIGNLELALDDLELGNYADVRQVMEKVMESAMFGAETVRRLQSFAGTNAQKTQSKGETFDLSEVVRQALEMTKTLWKILPEQEGIDVSLLAGLHDGCFVRGEKNGLFEVIVNLIRNATEALSRDGGVIDVQTSVKGNEVVFKIRDTGAGIGEENLKRVFNPFFTTKASAGSGLGLAISRKTVENCDGNIFVDSPGGKGTVFTILLPLAQKPHERREPPAEALQLGMTILVIDDMEAVLEYLRARLVRSGHVVVTAFSGEEGLRVYQEDTIDLVICDLEMPGMKGWEVGKRMSLICEQRHIPKTPFILLTGRGGQNTQTAKIAECQVDAVVEKPIVMENLLTLIRKVGKAISSKNVE